MVKSGKIVSKKSLEVVLSRLKGFSKANVRIEQYMTEPNIAAEIVWNGLFRGLIEGKVILDLGCGTGILGLGTLLAGANRVYFVDIDENVINIAKDNYEMLKSEGFKVGEAIFMTRDVKDLSSFDENIDLIIENPPFGTKSEHADKAFLEKAFRLSNNIYSFHKSESKRFIESISRDFGFRIIEYFEFKFPLKQTMNFHLKKIQYIGVGCWLFGKKS
ncbi:MAG: METTL5 family protein [Candidatus Woesearchaeota archaeon]